MLLVACSFPVESKYKMAAKPVPGERREDERSREQANPLRLQFTDATNALHSLDIQMFDAGGGGMGVISPVDLSIGMEVLLTGEWSGGDLHQKATVRWCRPTQNGRFRAGVELLGAPKAASAKPNDNQGQGKQEASQSSPPHEQPESEAADDYYELLQLHQKADPDTIQRVYRLMAQRYHPDNKETGNTERFRVITDAYQTLVNPERRASYDLKTDAQRQRRWKIFDQDSSANGVGDEKRKRDGILGVLYTKRLKDAGHPTMSIQEFEDLLGVAREQLEFSVWYLKEQGQIVRTDSGKYSITIKGVDAAEAAQAAWLTATNNARMIEAPQSPTAQ